MGILMIALLRFPDNLRTKFFSDEDRGLAYARQLGSENVDGDYGPYIDSDMELHNIVCLNGMLVKFKKRNGLLFMRRLSIQGRIKSYWEKEENFRWINTLTG